MLAESLTVSPSMDWSDPKDINGQIVNGEMKRLVSDRHGNKTNVVFGDTHVESINLKDLWTLKWHKGARPAYDIQF